MSLTAADKVKLRKIMSLAEEMLSKDAGEKVVKSKSNGKRKRIRRTGKELVEFRKMVKAERSKGVPVTKIAKRHGVSTAYLYMLQ